MRRTSRGSSPDGALSAKPGRGEGDGRRLCQQCPGGCGILVRTLDGEVAGISGNALHPINRGALCPKAFGGLQLLYDPHRLKGPMARDGKHGALRPIAWEEALRLATQRLAELRQQGVSPSVG